MAIQSATALSAYLTADSSGAYGAGRSASATEGESSASRAEGAVTPQQIEAAPAQALAEPAPDDDAPTSNETPLSPGYARNARPVMARAQTPSISLLA